MVKRAIIPTQTYHIFGIKLGFDGHDCTDLLLIVRRTKTCGKKEVKIRRKDQAVPTILNAVAENVITTRLAGQLLRGAALSQ